MISNVALSTDSAEVGNCALLKNNREAQARNLLDWKRGLVHRGGGDDPFEGDLFARFLVEGSSGASQSTRLFKSLPSLLPIQKSARQIPLEPTIALYVESCGPS